MNAFSIQLRILRISFILIFLFPLQKLTAEETEYNLEKLLEMVRENPIEPEIYRQQEIQAQSRSQAVDAVYDSKFEAQFSNTHDEAGSNSKQSPQKARIGQVGGKWTRLLQTGTLIQVGVDHQRQSLEFPPPGPSTQIAPGVVIPSVSGASSISYNPLYSTKLSLTLSQPLIKNFSNREILFQKELLKLGELAPAYQREIWLQGVQAEMESLFVQYCAAEEQIKLSKRGLNLSQKFLSLMQDRATIGRSDQVDVADARSSVVQREGDTLNAELHRDELLQQIRQRSLHNIENSDIGSLSCGKAFFGPWTESGATHELDELKIMERAISQRLDLKLLEKTTQSSQIKRELADEKNKVDLRAYASLSKTALKDGVGSSLSDSVSDWNGLKNQTWTIGLSLNMELGDTSYKSDMKSAWAEETEHKQKIQTMKRDIKRNVEKILLNYHASMKRIEHSKRQKIFLLDQKTKEIEKIKQARSEGIFLIAYDLELLGVEMVSLSAQIQKRMAEAQLNYVQHDYPRTSIGLSL